MKMKSYLMAIAVVTVLGIGVFAVTHASRREIAVINPQKSGTPVTNKESHKGRLTGTECEEPSERPLAVMLASDPEARPLAGIGVADMVIEMPVTESGVTRFMGIFNCEMPKEFGSIRSARMDFIPLVKGFAALFMHWGGEHEALAELNAGATENVDCLKYDGSACLRHSNIERPHNGYSTPTLFLEKAKALGYVMTKPFPAYQFNDKSKSQGSISPPPLYEGEFAVVWSYDAKTNSYLRSRGNATEIDRTTNSPVRAQNVILLKTTSQYVSILYNRVKTTGSDSATIYQNGQSIAGTWEKKSDSAKLIIKDSTGQEVRLVPGKTWFEFVTK